MKKHLPANPPVAQPNRSRPPRNRLESSTPAYHPATGQVLSEVEGGSPYLLKRPSQKTKINKGNRHHLMPTNKMTVSAKARKAMPDSANRPKTKVAGSTKKNTRMQPVLSEQEAKAAKKKFDARG